MAKKKVLELSVTVYHGYSFPEDKSQVVTDFKSNKKVAGVWACYGVPRDNGEEYVCLDVAQSSNIYREIRIDRMYSKGKNYNKKGVFKNYKGDEVFKFDRPLSTRQRKWKDIGEKYQYLKFVIIKENCNEVERRRIEKAYAIKHKARYWNPDIKQITEMPNIVD
ncbi:MAG: hypothetical protein MJ094_01175 [Saccharofermentans sp.]|nr:hypothetical protein [Saccharofermentans sp.]